ncbi:DUF202 domain-containing protein [Paraconexibacter antarcticus]|uniref:DUF202 domain-containing protein n=1 Tax=Paraconexibacter antarcticus TaxID=2949664 RepID=A0ABY5E0Y3_9ACTN|nr:DUF202 domain-containing protein [Paraconexibacter antarcticus]UTI66869.1 DUF202 domain-containing protein [Paraconexibacter antarcticus]
MADGAPRSALFDRHGDTGAQHERTSLAWARTAIAFLAIGGLLLRAARHMVVPTVGYLLGLGLLMAAAVLLFGQHEDYEEREGSLRSDAAIARPASLRKLAAITFAATVSALVGVVLLVV